MTRKRTSGQAALLTFIGHLNMCDAEVSSMLDKRRRIEGPGENCRKVS
jgi:hypothetical protein